jgi:hypothetical protein
LQEVQHYVLFLLFSSTTYLVFVQNHLDQLLVHAGQIDGGSERDAARLLQLEVDVRRMLVQPDSDALLYTEHNDQKLSLNSNQLVVKIVINI